MNVQAASVLVANKVMNQKQIILEHREALDEFDNAKSKQASCARKKTCEDKAFCLICPARLEKVRCEAVLKEKTSTLQQLNERIVTRNEQEALQQRIDRSIERKAKKQRVNNIEVRADKLMKKKSPAKPIYNRKDLTPERYIQHSQEEGKTDREIREMYDIPSGSFTKIKKDLLALIEGPPKNVPDSDEPDNDVALLQKVSKLETEYGTAVNQLEQAKQEIKELQQQIVAVNNQLTQEQQYNNELKAMVDYLENKNANESHSTTTSDAAVQDYKALYEQAQNALLNSEKVANDRLQTIEGLEKKITEIIFSTNKQNSKVQDYEIILLERLLQALYANRN